MPYLFYVSYQVQVSVHPLHLAAQEVSWPELLIEAYLAHLFLEMAWEKGRALNRLEMARELMLAFRQVLQY